MNAINAPKIRINANTGVSIDPIHSIHDLALVTAKFGKLVAADAPGSVMRLTTAVGDLTASVQDGGFGNFDMAEEVADVLIATMVVAASQGINGELLRQVIITRLGEQAQTVISTQFKAMLDQRMAA